MDLEVLLSWEQDEDARRVWIELRDRSQYAEGPRLFKVRTSWAIGREGWVERTNLFGQSGKRAICFDLEEDSVRQTVSATSDYSDEETVYMKASSGIENEETVTAWVTSNPPEQSSPQSITNNYGTLGLF